MSPNPAGVVAKRQRIRFKRIARLQYGDALATEERAVGGIQVFGSNGPIGQHDLANAAGPCILVGRKGSFGKLNRCSEPCFAIDTVFYIDPKHSKANLRWLYYCLQTLNLDKTTKDSAIPGLDREDVHDALVPDCSNAEQLIIAKFLDRESEQIDNLIQKKQRLIELLDEKRAALISRAVTQGLNPSVSMKDLGIDWLGHIPAHWQLKRVKWVASMESGHTPDKKVAAYWENCTIPWVSLNDTAKLRILDYIAETAFNVNELGIANSSARLLPAGAVIFSRDATIGLCAITVGAMAVSQHFIAWICRPAISPEYLLFVFRSMTQFLDSLTTGATLKTIGMPEVRMLTIPVPPIDEQLSISKFIKGERAVLSDVIAKTGQQIEALREYRSALITAAVTGQLGIHEHEKKSEVLA